ncbi:MAG: hypothetical protein QN632_08710 [Nitrososphaeraceae archaeon]|nr:hypothetical protein [Nitrososphaeraceae archaeon]
MNLDQPHLRFYLYNTTEIPMKLLSKEDYMECSSYEPMVYRPENWDSFNEKQLEHYKYFEDELNRNGHLVQVGKIAVSNNQEFLERKHLIEEKDTFDRWIS